MFKHATLNRAYRLVWSELRNTWIAVAEFACARGKRSSVVIAAGTLLAVGAGMAIAAGEPSLTALPTGGQIVAGQVGISSNGVRMDVTQSSPNAIVNWTSFNVGSQAHINFAQPDATAVILNRVMGGDASAIFGRITANGQVFLTNPGGILFAPGAQVDVGGLVASSLGISDANFLAGKYQFERLGAAGTVVNQGAINAAQGGYVALIAPQVSNAGTITAARGSVGLAAASKVNLDFDHDGLLSFQVDVGEAGARAGNSGLIAADGGRVVMNAQAKDALLSTVLNNEGVIRARGLESRNGEIWLGGGNSGVVSVTGTLDASGTANGQVGGVVKALGANVGLFEQAKVDVSGVGAGGTALIGGNWQGKGPEQNANATFVGKDVVISADAVGSGNGGKVVVWADGTTRFAGHVTARGGVAGGNGGAVEISGHEHLVFRGSLDLAAPNGRAGSVLFDPKNITVADTGADSIATNDAFAENPAADATFDADLITALTNAGTAVTLQANNDITVNEAITSNNAGGNGGALTLHAGRSIALNANVTTDSGDFSAIANHAGAQALNRDVGNATIAMAGGATVDAGSGAISFSYGNGPNGNDATGAISLASLTTTGTIALSSAANSGGSASTQAVTASGTISAGTLDLQSATSFTFNGNVSATTLSTAASGYSVSFLGSTTSVTNAVTFNSTGALTLGNGGGEVLTFSGGVIATAPSGVTLNGELRTAGNGVSLGDGNTAITLAGGTKVDTTNASANPAGAGISFGGTVDGAFNLTLDAGNGATSFSAAVGGTTPIGTGTGAALTINSTGTTTFDSTLATASGITSANAAGNLTFKDNVTIAAGDTASTLNNAVVNLDGLSFESAGNVTLGNAATDQVNLTTGAVTLKTTGTGTLTAEAKVDGAQNLTLDTAGAAQFKVAVGGTTPIGTGTGAALTINSTGTTTFDSTLATASGITSANAAGNLTFKDNITVGNGNTGTALDGNVIFNRVGGFTFASGGSVTLGNASTDQVTLSVPMTINTSAANASQTINAKVDGANSLTLSAGSGSVSIGGATGSATPLTSLTITGGSIGLGTIGAAGNGVTGNVVLTGSGAVTLGASKIGGYLDIIGGGAVSQDDVWNIGGDLWVRNTSGDITLMSLNVLAGRVSLIGSGTGAKISLYANRIDVNTLEAPSGAGGVSGILGTTVILQADKGSDFVAKTGLTGGLVKATSTATSTAALTIKTIGSNGNVVTGAIGSTADLALRVETSGLVVVEGNGVSDGSINLKGDDQFQPKYEFSGNPLYRRVLYNGNEATNAQLTGALDAAYLDIRNMTTEIRESGFAKENASKVLRRGVVTSAGPGQPAVDDSTGMAGSEECEGGFANGSLSCQ
jgi:filamentous hemagglutinin family protein